MSFYRNWLDVILLLRLYTYGCSYDGTDALWLVVSDGEHSARLPDYCIYSCVAGESERTSDSVDSIADSYSVSKY